MTPVTLVMAYYENPDMLELQYKHIGKLPPDILANLRVIIVDDGSPQHPAASPAGKLRFFLRIYRMGVDVRWNQDACRNVGVRHADTDWIFLTDMDHLVPEKVWRFAMRPISGEDVAWTFERVDYPSLNPNPKHHPNTWFMRRSFYEKVGGYDERFAGLYGTDGDFATRLRAAGEIRRCREAVIRVPREAVADASTTAYERKTAEDRIGLARVRRERAAVPNWRPLRYSFPYERVYPET
jgi:hypothetical protein